MSQKWVLGLMLVLLVSGIIITSCSKKQNPLGPDSNTPDVPNPTATTIPSNPGKSTIVVKTMFGNNPLSNVNCNVLFAGQQAKSSLTDSEGKAIFVENHEGDFTATIPTQGDILKSSLNGCVALGKTNTVIFQTGGSVVVTPTAVQYDYEGGNFPIVITYSEGANSLHTKVTPSILNLPVAWTSSFTGQNLVDGQSTTVTVSVPCGSEENAMNLKISMKAQSGAIIINSQPFAIYKEWVEYGDIKVTIMNGTVGMAGINFIVTDSKGQTYTATTQSGGEETVRINATGTFTINVPEQGLIAQNGWADTVGQGQVYEHTFQVGSADINVIVQHNGSAYTNLPIRVTDANGVQQNKNTDGTNGQVGFHLNAIGDYTVEIPGNGSQNINLSTKTGTIKQNQTANVSFNGDNGYFEISSSIFGYPYQASNHTINITYRNSGDISYYLGLDNPGIPGGVGLTYSYSPNNYIGVNETKQLIINSGLGSTWSRADCSIPGAKGGQQAFTIYSGNINIYKNWDVTISISHPYWVYCEVLDTTSSEHPAYGYGRFDYNVTGSNIPNGTIVMINVTYTMPTPAPVGDMLYASGVTLNHAGNVTCGNYSGSIEGDRIDKSGTPHVSVQKDGTLTINYSLGGLSKTSTFPLYY